MSFGVRRLDAALEFCQRPKMVLINIQRKKRLRRIPKRRQAAALPNYLPANAFAVAFTIASDVIVALLVVSTPFTCCLAMIFAGVSVIAE